MVFIISFFGGILLFSEAFIKIVVEVLQKYTINFKHTNFATGILSKRILSGDVLYVQIKFMSYNSIKNLDFNKSI